MHFLHGWIRFAQNFHVCLRMVLIFNFLCFLPVDLDLSPWDPTHVSWRDENGCYLR